MYLFKTAGSTIDGVIKNKKHAFHAKPRIWYIGEVVLLSKNKLDCHPSEKQIQYIARIENIREANPEEIERYWPGNKYRWKYIVDLYDMTSVPSPFNLEDVLGEERANRYRVCRTFAKVDEEDERVLVEYLNLRKEF
jgi:hypothetical protein